MGKEICNLQPAELWKHFYEFTQIPRPSKHEQKVIEYILNFAKATGLNTKTDAVGNIIVSKPATPGMENSPGVILQSHVDMVPQKNSSKSHDFLTDPIETLIDEGWVKANQTTLGADNGIGCAAMLAILESEDVKHGPLEALFTINEEAGMEGALGLKSNVLQGEIMINLDSEDEGELFVGCAGGLNVQASSEYKLEKAEAGIAYEISVSGLKGGHSGMDINLGRGNSNKILGRLLWSLLSNMRIQIAYFKGGDLRNAIPREATAKVVVPAELETDFESFVNHFAMLVKAELSATEPELEILFQKSDMPDEVIHEEEALRLFGLVASAHNGVVRMSDSMPGIVETSLNLAIVNIEKGKAEYFYLIRSSVDSAKYALADQVTAMHKIAGCSVDFSGDYPGWKPNPQSKIVKVATETYKYLYNTKPGLWAIHAGLECGIIGGKYANLDMISFGPTIRFPHSPDEKVHIDSVDKFYTFLKETLSALK